MSCVYRESQCVCVWLMSCVYGENLCVMYVVDVTFCFVFQHLTFTREFDSDSLRHYSWAADTLDNVNLVSSPVHSG